MRAEEMDPQVGLKDQVAGGGDGPVTLAILFTVAPVDAEAFLAAWAEDAAWNKTQPGFITAQLHRGVGSSTFLDVAVFETSAALGALTQQPEFGLLRGIYPNSTVGRMHLFRRVAVPGICLGEPAGSGQPASDGRAG